MSPFRARLAPRDHARILAGCIITYAASITVFVIQTLIGGARLWLEGELVTLED